MDPDRRHGVAIVPATWDVDEAVEEVRWARANGLGSIMLPVTWGDHKPYHHPCYRPLWAECEELGVVVHFHSGPADSEQYFGSWPPNPDEPPLRGAMGIYVSEVAWFVARPLTFLIWGGESITEYLFKIYWRNLAQSLQHEMRMQAYLHLQNLDLRYFEDQSSGELMSILNDDVNQL